jgi:hypothetical protein
MTFVNGYFQKYNQIQKGWFLKLIKVTFQKEFPEIYSTPVEIS